MKSFRNPALAFLTMLLTASAVFAEELPLPSAFAVKQKVLAFKRSFYFEDGRGQLGTATKKILAWGDSFEVFDADGTKVAEGRKRVFSWGNHIDVYDVRGQKIGAIRERVFQSLFKWYTVYDVEDGAGNAIATSEKEQLLSTTLTLRQAGNGRLVATMNRPAFRWKETWNVKVADKTVVDARVLVLLAIYKSDATLNQQ